MKVDKFVWSGVTSETKFVSINDIKKNFKFLTCSMSLRMIF